MTKFIVKFKQGDSYRKLEVRSKKIALSFGDPCAFYADAVRIELDEPIIEIVDTNGRPIITYYPLEIS